MIGDALSSTNIMQIAPVNERLLRESFATVVARINLIAGYRH